MLDALLLITVLILPLTVLVGFAILPATWNKVFFLVAGLAILLAWSVFPGGAEEWFPISVFVKLSQLVALALAMALGFTIRWARRRLSARKARQTDSTPSEPNLQTEWPNLVFGALLALCAPVFISYHGAFGRADGDLLFSAVAIIVILLIATSVILYRLGKHALLATSASFGVSIVAISLYAFQTGSVVQAAASATANGRPYCIQSGNQTVYGIQDLTFLTLRAPKNTYSYLNYHGLLVVKDDDTTLLYNWSYQRREFRPANMTYKPDIICTPKITS